jgi:hypothetical protein
LIGSFAVPNHDLLIVKRDTSTARVHVAQIDLRIRIVLISGFTVPSDGLLIVSRNAPTLRIHVAEMGLRHR